VMMRRILLVSNMPHPLLTSTFKDWVDVAVVVPKAPAKGVIGAVVNSLFFLWVVVRFSFANPGSKGSVNFHYPNIRFLPAFLFLFSTGRAIRLSLWGSDYLKVAGWKKKILSFMISRATAVSVASESAADNVAREYSCPREKVFVSPFLISDIDNYLLRSCSSKSDIDGHRLFVLCGTNGSENQQFNFIANALNSLSLEASRLVKFRFHIAYGGDPSYFISDQLNKCVDVEFDKTFYRGAELVEYRHQFHVLIQIQKTDQLSAAMLEHLALGAVVITGSWLPYKSLLQAGIYMYLIDRPDDLARALQDVIFGFDKYKDLSKNNKNVVKRNFSKVVVLESWRKFFRYEI